MFSPSQASSTTLCEHYEKETFEQKAWREHILGTFNRMTKTLMDRMDRFKVSIPDRGNEKGPETFNNNRRNKNRVANNLDIIKMNIPLFQGKTEKEAYLDWKVKIENIFEIHYYLEEKKVLLASVKFVGYALT